MNRRGRDGSTRRHCGTDRPRWGIRVPLKFMFLKGTNLRITRKYLRQLGHVATVLEDEGLAAPPKGFAKVPWARKRRPRRWRYGGAVTVIGSGLFCGFRASRIHGLESPAARKPRGRGLGVAAPILMWLPLGGTGATACKRSGGSGYRQSAKGSGGSGLQTSRHDHARIRPSNCP